MPTVETAPQALMSDREAATYLRLTQKWSHISVQRWALKGVLKGGKVGKHWRFRKEDLDDFIFARK